MRETTLQNRQRALKFIRDYQRQYHIAPTLEEIGWHIYGKAAQRGNVKVRLTDPLVAAGFLKLTGRGLMVTAKGKRKDYTEGGQVK